MRRTENQPLVRCIVCALILLTPASFVLSPSAVQAQVACPDGSVPRRDARRTGADGQSRRIDEAEARGRIFRRRFPAARGRAYVTAATACGSGAIATASGVAVGSDSNAGEVITDRTRRPRRYGERFGVDDERSGNVAIGARANSSGLTGFNTATGFAANASGNGGANIAVGVAANASGHATDNIAIGENALANGAGGGGLAVGAGSSATHTNAAAFGGGATTIRDGQQVFGTADNTYTFVGIGSAASEAAQNGSIGVVTTDAGGNLAVDSEILGTVSSLGTRLTANEANDRAQTFGIIVTLGGVIANGQDIAAVEGTVASNTGAILSNATGIQTNTDAITGIAVDVSSNTGAITTNTAGIRANDQAISRVTTDVATNRADIANGIAETNLNRVFIFDNATGIASNATTIETNANTIGTVADTVSSNTGSILTNATAIRSNGAALAGVATEVSVNRADIAMGLRETRVNTTAISDNVTAISANTVNTLANTTRLTTVEGGVAANADASASNAMAITGNTTALIGHETRLQSTELAVTGQANRIGALESSLSGVRDDIDDLRAGVAMSLALNSIPTVNGKQFSLGLGFGTYEGEAGFATKATVQFSPNVAASFGVSMDSRRNVGAAGGIAFGF